MAYNLQYSDYSTTTEGPPDPARWVGPPGPPGPMPPGGPFLPLSGGTVAGPLQLGAGTGTPTLILNGAAGTAKGVYWQTAGTNRWRLQTDASENLGLYQYDATGVWKGTGALFTNDGSAVQFNSQVQINSTTANPPSGVLGLWQTVTNSGSNIAEGAKFTYFSSAGSPSGNSGGFDIGLTQIAIYDPTSWSAGPQFPSYDSVWIVAVSPNDATHGWAANGMELDISNRGPDMGWKRDRYSANPTGGILVAAETATFGGTGGGEGKNATFAYTVGHSGETNSTGFFAKFYNGYLIEPNAIVGQTGRAIYATGDTSGTASQYPYGPLQTDGTWLHGIDHTKAVYTDGRAETLAVGQALGWIVGPTTAPTAVATIAASGSGANASLTLTPAGTGTIALVGPTAHASTVGFNNTAPIAKPTVTGAKGGNAALASLITALAAYGLVTDSTTA